MKYIILLLVMLSSNFTWACINQIAESEIPKAIALEPGAGAKKCGASDPCVCFDGIKWETAVYADVSVNDPTKPIYSTPQHVQACATIRACRALIALDYCESPDHALYREVSGGGYEAYCTHVTGYQQKLVKKLITDPTKKTSYDAQQVASATEKSLKAQKALARRAFLISCAKLDNTATAAQVRACTIANSKELVRQYLLSTEE